MKRAFSTSWNASKQPRKQRKYVAKAPLHTKHKFMGAPLSKDLKKKYAVKTIPLRTDDVVKIMRGKFKGKEGKVLKVNARLGKIEVENIQVTKLDGSKANVRLVPSNVQIITLYTEDKKRLAKLKKDKANAPKAASKTPKSTKVAAKSAQPKTPKKEEKK